jgi:hypothetical protein
MKVFILIDWEAKHIIVVYAELKEAESDKNRFIKENNLKIVIRDLIFPMYTFSHFERKKK